MFRKKYTELELTNKLNLLVNDIKEIITIDKVILFGSYAKGNPHDYSDIDIAIISENIDPNLSRWQNIEQILKKSCFKFDPDIQLIPISKKIYENDKTSAIGSFIREIKKTGRVIYNQS